MKNENIINQVDYDFKLTEEEFKHMRRMWELAKKLINEKKETEHEIKNKIGYYYESSLSTSNNVSVRHYDDADLTSNLTDQIKNKIQLSIPFYESGFKEINKTLKIINNIIKDRDYDIDNPQLYKCIVEIVHICDNCIFYNKSFWEED